MFRKQENRWRINRDRVTKLWARTWYAAVRNVENLSDPQLDMKFDPKWHPLNTSNARLKMFEQIRREGSLPSDGSHPKRKDHPFDLVEIVDGFKGYKGTASLFHSPFWHLLRHQRMDVLTLRKFIVHCLILVKKDYRIDDYLVSELEIQDLGLEELLDHDSFFDNTNELYQHKLPLFVDQPVTFDLLALLGAMFRDAYISGELRVALSLENTFMEKLHELHCQYAWINEELSKEIFEVSKERIFRPNLFDDPSKVPSHSDVFKQEFPDMADCEIERFMSFHHKLIWENSS